MARFSLFLNHHLKQGLTLVFLSVLVMGAQAQIQLVGNVVDGETGEPMFSASVTLEGTTKGENMGKEK